MTIPMQLSFIGAGQIRNIAISSKPLVLMVWLVNLSFCKAALTNSG